MNDFAPTGVRSQFHSSLKNDLRHWSRNLALVDGGPNGSPTKNEL